MSRELSIGAKNQTVAQYESSRYTGGTLCHRSVDDVEFPPSVFHGEFLLVIWLRGRH